MTIRVGDTAPDFELPGVLEGDEALYRLSDFGGQSLVLVFYPADNSPVCTKQLVSYTDDIGHFNDAGAQVLALSPQPVDSHRAFADKHDLAFPLLSDSGKAVGQAYGVLGPIGFYRRSVFVIDAEGLVTYAHRAVAGITFRPTDELVRALDQT
ncbi:MAG: peroxiredoxin [Actinomycetia bacterium]|nr:peroxiredoxin [Actinomycetes bacterium]